MLQMSACLLVCFNVEIDDECTSRYNTLDDDSLLYFGEVIGLIIA